MAWVAPVMAIAGSAIGNQQASADRRSAANARQQAISQFMNLQLPDIDKQKITPELLEYIGDLQMQQEGALNLGPSEMQGVSTDPRLADAQMGALSQLTEIGETGLLPGERAALNQARRGAAAESQAKSAQLLDEYARRGMGGSGSELAARLQSAQSGGDRLSQENDRLMQMAQQRALSAISQQGNLAGQIRGQSFGEQSDVAQAQDAINRFNTANQQSVQQRNVGANNAATQRNLSEQQRIGEARAGQKNMAQQYNKELQQQQFSNQLNLAAGRAGQFTGAANASQQQAGRTADMWAGIGRGAGTAIATYNQGQKNDEDDLVKEFNRG